MALSAASPAGISNNEVVGRQRQTKTAVTFDSSYPTGGEALSASLLGLNVINTIISVGISTPAGSVTSVVHDSTNGKLIANTAAAQVANTTDLSALVVHVVAQGF